MELNKIKPYHKNTKKHPDRQIKQLAESIKQFGWQQPIKVGRDGEIIVGHGRWAAWKKYPKGMKEPWIIDEEGKTIHGGPETRKLTISEERAYRLADNKLNESRWDMRLVREELKKLEPAEIDLTGFSRDLILETDDRDDNAPPLPDSPKTKPGDLYEIGGHRIYCGDATERYDVLMGGAEASMLFTDPPYNIDYKGAGKKTTTKILNDKMGNSDFVIFLRSAFSQIRENIKTTAGCYIFHSHKTMMQFQIALAEAGFIIDTQLIWNKPSAGLGMNDYRTKHEPFFYCGLRQKKDFYGDRTGTTVWNIPENTKKALEWFRSTLKHLEGGDTSIWSASRDSTINYVHPTQKPVEIAMKAIIKSSQRGEIVLDPFIGSGTTLIAAQKSNRECYGMDLDPRYIDVTVERYLEYMGEEEIIKNGKTIKW